MTKRCLALAILVLLVLAGRVSAQPKIPAECEPMIAAGQKQFTVASHAAMTTTGLSQAPLYSEVINVGGATYVKLADRWMKSPMTSEQLAKQSLEKLATLNSTCKQLPDETIGGVAAHVYSAHTERDTGSTDSHVWVAKSTGLPLKSEIELQLPGGKKSHVLVTYDYEDVKAPEGVK
jgi:hypothetical protein